MLLLRLQVLKRGRDVARCEDYRFRPPRLGSRRMVPRWLGQRSFPQVLRIHMASIVLLKVTSSLLTLEQTRFLSVPRYLAIGTKRCFISMAVLVLVMGLRQLIRRISRTYSLSLHRCRLPAA